MLYKAPYLPYDTIRKYALRFLNEFHPSASLPVPIEEIVEFKLKINIIPMPNMKRDFDLEGFLSKDFSSIYVDSDTSERLEPRYRFTLAHEIGHMILHRDFYDAVQYSSLTEWAQFQDTIDSDQYSWFETQAYDFAGLILVPEQHLFDEYKIEVERLREQSYTFSKANFDTVNEYICIPLSKRFKVSQTVIRKRIYKDDLAPNVV
ncbi:MAG: ImmA/IrrE family metallo-endopeptidase [candidate division Zixibacteria bacterium]|nr:ImmA/IrrE family metallo-endopeptidase [candidate division Zixibacteria bacterium]